MDESAPLTAITDDEEREADAIDACGAVSALTYGPLYGGLKARCEAAAEEVLPGRVLRVRAGLIVGAHDYTDRFTYWVVRVARGGEVLAPGDPQRHVQFIDARDLADWVMEAIEQRVNGVFNVGGPSVALRLTMSALLETCRDESGSDARFTWVSDAFLREHGVRPWTELPLWIPAGTRDGMMAVDVRKAMAAGLRQRPLRETVRDVLQQHGRDRALRAGLDADRERELLRSWHERA